DALYGVYLGFGFSGNETTDGYGAVRSGDADGVDLLQAAVLLRIADADVHLFLCVVGSVVAHENAIGQQLHGAAHFRDAGAEHGGASAIDGDLPLNARNRGSIVDIDESGHFIGYVVADPARLRDQCVQIFAVQLDLQLLAHRRAGFNRRDFRGNARNILNGLAIQILDLESIDVPGAPIGKF